jgi:hypothetical protein
LKSGDGEQEHLILMAGISTSFRPGRRMRLWRQQLPAALMLVVLATPNLCFARVDLPKWSSGDDEKYQQPGSAPLAVGLWPDEMLGGGTSGTPNTMLADGKGADAKTGDGGDKKPQVLVIPDGEGLLETSESPTKLPLGPVGKIEFTPMEMTSSPLEIRTQPNEIVVGADETRRLFLRQRPLDFLVDPLALLTEQRSNDVSRFLEYHSEEAPFDICLLVLRENERIPEGTSLAALHKKWFGEERVALVVYPFGQPRKTLFEFGPAVRDRVSSTVVGRIEQSCVAEAAVGADPSDQVERLSIELSIRLYWLGRILDRPQSMTEAEAEAAADLQRVADSEGAGGKAIFGRVMTWGWLFVGALASVIAGAVLRWLVRRNSLNGEPLFFPDRELAARLGGPCAGGRCASLSFRFGSEDPSDRSPA